MGVIQSTPPPLSYTVYLGPSNKISLAYTAMIMEEPFLHLQEVCCTTVPVSDMIDPLNLPETDKHKCTPLSCQQAKLYKRSTFFLLCRLGSTFSFVTQFLFSTCSF